MKTEEEIKAKIKGFKAKRTEAKKYEDETEEQFYDGAIRTLKWILYDEEID